MSESSRYPLTVRATIFSSLIGIISPGRWPPGVARVSRVLVQ
jgi:hypothetical protein